MSGSPELRRFVQVAVARIPETASAGAAPASRAQYCFPTMLPSSSNAVATTSTPKSSIPVGMLTTCTCFGSLETSAGKPGASGAER